MGVSVERILNQLFYDRRGPFDNFAGRDLIDQRVRKEANSTFFVSSSHEITHLEGGILNNCSSKKFSKTNLQRVNMGLITRQLECRQEIDRQ